MRWKKRSRVTPVRRWRWLRSLIRCGSNSFVMTRPIRQACGNGAGMAIASRWLGARYNRPDSTLFDFDVYTICSDGDLMEGVASEAASLAGHLQLANLCWIYDSNTVTIEGHTDLA